MSGNDRRAKTLSKKRKTVYNAVAASSARHATVSKEEEQRQTSCDELTRSTQQGQEMQQLTQGIENNQGGERMNWADGYCNMTIKQIYHEVRNEMEHESLRREYESLRHQHQHMMHQFQQCQHNLQRSRMEYRQLWQANLQTQSKLEKVIEHLKQEKRSWQLEKRSMKQQKQLLHKCIFECIPDLSNDEDLFHAFKKVLLTDNGCGRPEKLALLAFEGCFEEQFDTASHTKSKTRKRKHH